VVVFEVYVLGEVPFVVVPFLLDEVTEDAVKGQISTSVSSDTSVSSTTFFHSLPLIHAVPSQSPLPQRKDLELNR
jgi:hypothetical protein